MTRSHARDAKVIGKRLLVGSNDRKLLVIDEGNNLRDGQIECVREREDVLEKKKVL